MIIKFLVFLLVVYGPGAQESGKKENKAFKVGESLKFSIGWEFIDAGTATLSVSRMTTIDNQPCYHFTAITRSNAFFSTLYKVRDTLESYMHAEKFYPLKYIKNANEGDYKRSFVTVFDHHNAKAMTDDRDSGKSQISIPPDVQDIISAFYYMRTRPIEVGSQYELSVFDNGRHKKVTVKVIRKETVSVEAGEFDCIVVQTPIGPFKNRSDLFIWLTDDARKMPVLMKSKIVIGSVHAELEEYSGTY